MAKQPIPPEVGVEIAQAFEAGGTTKTQVLNKYQASPWGFSRNKLYQIANAFGWSSGRKQRDDKGEIRIDGVTNSDIEMAAKVLMQATRYKTGKRLMATEDLKQQMVLNGYEEMANVSVSTMNRWLRDRKLDHQQLMADNPAIEMRSKHPNHIHFVDASVCVQWDLKGGKKMVARDMQKAFYKNKPGYWKTVKKVLIRWLLVDHCSGMFYVDYTYESGESSISLLNFLLDAWSPKPYADLYPFHGVPFELGLDPGAANKSYEVKNLTGKLGVKREVHAPGNSRASGPVETIHNFWERRFEWELLLKLADDLDDLRTRAHDRMIFLNATAVHSRHKWTRCAKWMEITQDQLRILPPRAHCEKLATCQPFTRVPDERLRIEVDNREFQLKAPALKRRPVTVDYTPWDPDQLNVWTSDGEMVPCRLIQKDEHGFDVLAPVYGEGEYKRHADTPAQKLRKELEALPKAERLNGFEPKSTAHLAPKQHFLPKRGTDIVLNELPKAPPIAADDVPGKLRRSLGRERLTSLQNQQIQTWLKGRAHVTAQEFEEIQAKAADAWKTPRPPSAATVTPIKLKATA